MSETIAWLEAQAERIAPAERKREGAEVPIEDLPRHDFPRRTDRGFKESHNPQPVAQNATTVGSPGEDASDQWWRTEDSEEKRKRRIYRGRTVAMLRKYMRYSIETGRLPSLLGREFFRSKVTAYTVVTFEDRVIFVHDMETSLDRLDEFSRQLIARHILQEHDQAETGRLLQCTERTVRTYVPIVLDLLSEILIERGLLETVESKWEKSCQGGKNGPFSVSDCEEGENKF